MRSHSEAFREPARVWRECRAERVRADDSQRWNAADRADLRPVFLATVAVQSGKDDG